MKQLYILLLIIAVGIIPFKNYSQANKIDSLKHFIKSAKNDTTKAKAISTLGKEYEFIDQDSAVLFLKKAYALSEDLKYEKGKGINLIYLGYIAEDRSDYDSANVSFTSAYEIFKKTGDKAWQAEILKLFGEISRYRADLKQALNFYLQSLELYESINSDDGIAGVNYSLGGLYMDLQRFDKALESYLQGYEINKKANNEISMANDMTAIGIVYDRKKEYKKAKEYYLDAKKIYEANNYDNGLSNLLTWMAITAYNEKDLSSALEYFQQSLKLYEKMNSINGLIYAYNNIGSIYAEQGLVDKAIEWENKSLEMALKYKVVDNIRYAYEMLSVSYEKKGDYKKAYESHKLFMQYKDSILNESTSKQLSELDKKFESEKKNKELIKKDAELLKQNLKIDKQNNQRNYLLIGLVLMVMIALFIFRSYRQKQKANEVIAMQKLEVENQKELIEEKQKEIVDSITYAKRLQQAILPPLKFVKEHIPENFILFKPKDIVAGDFYWMEYLDETIYIAAADCTGHGVPGAMVSVVCSNALNRTVKEFSIKEPGKILDKVRDLVIETFEKSESEVKDGMDISLCSIRSKGNKFELNWAGANNPLWIIREDQLLEWKPNKQSIGKTETPKPFTDHKIELQKGDSLYLFTDGYADQFGGVKGKKFKYKKLQELLISINKRSMKEQELILNENIEAWKGTLEQVDDILVIGIKP